MVSFDSNHSLIKGINAMQILDSRGNPTIKTTVFTECGAFSASVPSGASTGKFEAFELRDNGKAFHGKGVQKAVNNVNKKIAPKLKGKSCLLQKELDELMIELDGSENKRNLGANAILSVSLALARAGAFHSGKQLHEYLADFSCIKLPKKPCFPVPMLNIINGGKHAGLENDIQEHMIVPNGKKFSENLRISAEVYTELKKLLSKKFGATAVMLGDEGGFAPLQLKDTHARLDLMQKAIDNLGYAKKFSFALDCAASEFYNLKTKKYSLWEKKFSAEKLTDFYEELFSQYNIVSIEDPFAENDLPAWINFTQSFGKCLNIVGDDLLVTNPEKILIASDLNACNSLLLKVNQIGTLTEAINALMIARASCWNVIVSHRSGETEDAFIADLAVALQAEFVKFGAPARSERTCKYNRLLELELK